MICFMIYQSIWRLSHYEDHLDVSEGAFIWHDSGAPAAFTSRIRQISRQHVRKAGAKDSIVYSTSQLMLGYGVRHLPKVLPSMVSCAKKGCQTWRSYTCEPLLGRRTGHEGVSSGKALVSSCLPGCRVFVLEQKSHEIC